MSEQHEDPSFDDFDEINVPPSEAPEFNRIADELISRRTFLGGSALFGATAMIMGSGLALSETAAAASRLDFKPVSANALDTVTLPEGYNWQVVASWGDPLWSESKVFDEATGGTGASQELAVGDNNDGMSLYSWQGRNILAFNNEYVNRIHIYRNRVSRRPENSDDVRKGKAGHGITVCEIRQVGQQWNIVRDSRFNRRITADTPMHITGPASGHDMLKTAADPSGSRSLGTWNNCGNGRTPWNSYLACEENFNDYFSSSDPGLVLTGAQRRYGIGHRDQGYRWAAVDARFDIARHPNEAHRCGYVVEVDPPDPAALPKKRTALGRFKHENAELVMAADGRVVVYMGDDEQGEYLYRFISAAKFVAGGNNDDLLEDGQLYVARFDNNGAGEWIELTPQSTGMASQSEICILTRLAASRVAATTMDRPEWVAANPHKAEVYCSLTNNRKRGIRPNKGGDSTPVGGPNPRRANQYGQIVRWRPEAGDHAANGFSWDLFVVAGNPGVHADANAGSDNINPDNMFNSPDGLSFDQAGRLWIRTDGNDSNKGDYAGMGNNQMLLADPASGEIRRFMVGPRECEITGVCWSPDRRTAFVGIQHPGERGGSHFPGGGNSVARSSVIAIQRDDGGLVG